MLRFKRCVFVTLLLGTAVVGGCGVRRAEVAHTKEAWDSHNNPLRFNSAYVTTFSKLPITGIAKQKPWSDTYWPSYQGGIAARWQQNIDGFEYVPYSREELAQMGEQDLMLLSPAEKYDILMMRYDYPTVVSERVRNRPDAKEWEGLCHGWAPASILYPEPRPVVMVNGDGLRIPFGASDVKSLLTHYLGVVVFDQKRAGVYKYLGLACREDLTTDEARRGIAADSPSCRDMNAGAFHVTLANEVGIKKSSFIVDIQRDSQIWNQPVMSYYTEVVGQGVRTPRTSPLAKKLVRMHTKMRFAAEVQAHWSALANGEANRSVVTNYTYDLELDAQGRIIGGEWLGWERPDFLWSHAALPFEGYWTGIGDLLSPVQVR